MLQRILVVGVIAAVAALILLMSSSAFSDRVVVPAGAADPEVIAPDPGDLTPYLRFSGSGVVSVRPDIASLTINNSGRGETAAQARAAAQDKLDQIAGQIREIASGAELKTEPIWSYRETDGSWLASAGLTVNKIPLDDVQPILDLALRDPASQISGPYYGLEQTEQAQREAIRKAIQEARRKADGAAEVIGARVVGVVSIDESASGGFSPPIMARDQAIAEGIGVGTVAPSSSEPSDARLDAVEGLEGGAVSGAGGSSAATSDAEIIGGGAPEMAPYPGPEAGYGLVDVYATVTIVFTYVAE